MDYLPLKLKRNYFINFLFGIFLFTSPGILAAYSNQIPKSERDSLIAEVPQAVTGADTIPSLSHN